MKLYLIRHGQTDYNQREALTGWANATLTSKGIRDAEGIAPLLAQVKFDKIYTSALTRTKQTAESAIPGCKTEETELINEINIGKQIEEKTHQECVEIYGQKFEVDRKNFDFSSYGGETANIFRARLKRFLDEVAACDYDCVAAFSHGGVLVTILSMVLEAEFNRKKIICDNCTVCILDYTDGVWSLDSYINPR